MFGGMNFFDALLHAFSTAGTGGFSNKNSSVAYYDSAYIDGVITVFMILFGVNFNLYFLLRLRNWKEALKNEELHAYLGIIAGSIAIISLNIVGMYGNILHAFRYASFQVAAIITTTGFCTANYNLWPELSKTILLSLMIIGACAGSTGGGIKVSRILISWKNLRKFCFTYWFMSSHWQLAACWLQSEKKFLLWDSSALPWTGVLIPFIWI